MREVEDAFSHFSYADLNRSQSSQLRSPNWSRITISQLWLLDNFSLLQGNSFFFFLFSSAIFLYQENILYTEEYIHIHIIHTYIQIFTSYFSFLQKLWIFFSIKISLFYILYIIYISTNIYKYNIYKYLCNDCFLFFINWDNTKSNMN